MNIMQANREVKKLTSILESDSKIKACCSPATFHIIAALRFCGLQAGAKTFECNHCGLEVSADQAVPVLRDGAAALVCRAHSEGYNKL